MMGPKEASGNPDSVSALLAALQGVLDETIPLNRRHRLELGRDIRTLWEDLTSDKERRTSEYLGSPAIYSAYARYFLPWNILRLASIFEKLPLEIHDGTVAVDIGSGPLTVPIALYAARPEFRKLKITFYCADRTERITKLGQTLFESLAARLTGEPLAWKIITVHHSFGARLPEKADLFTAANVFNEFFWKGHEPLADRAIATARQITAYLKDNASVFLMEPGDPRSGSFITAIRAALASAGFYASSPCPHQGDCPMPGMFGGLDRTKEFNPRVVMPKRRDKYPWCHFTIGAERAPEWLIGLSEEAKLPKDKLVYSYLLSARGGPKPEDAKIRVVSEKFPLPGGAFGRYACSAKGYTLVRYNPERNPLASGDLIDPASRPARDPSLPATDEKSGAILVSY
jgi:hypothetical protein